jgi:selenocysteine lyase/cysteine desulfurase
MTRTDLPLDPEAVRANFPAFLEPSLQDQAFFENAGGSYTCAPVLAKLDHYYRATKVQPYGAYPASEEAGSAMDAGYARMAAVLGVPENWVHFGPSTSANTYTLGQAFAAILEQGDAIIVTNQDHEANSGAWRRLANQGVEVRKWQVDAETGHLDSAGLDRLLDEKVRLVAFPHASNIAGEINPVAEICAKIRSIGAVSVVDGVSYAPHGFPDVAALGADIYFFSAYKTYGPHQGVMTIRPDLAETLPNQSHFFNDDQPRKRFNPAGPDHAQIAAAAGIADYIERLAKIAGHHAEGADPFRKAHNATRAQETALLGPLLDYLRARNDIRLIGPSIAAQRVPTISLALGEPGAAVSRRLSRHGIMSGGGHFYAWRLLEGLGIEPERGVLRLSFVHYTTPAEIERLIAALDAEL